MTDERATRGVEHLQAAAMEMIAAARAFLDVVEDVVADREKMADVVSAVGTVARDVGDAAKDVAEAATRSASRSRGTSTDDPSDDTADADEGVQRIPVS
jgi:hypothetical protein